MFDINFTPIFILAGLGVTLGLWKLVDIIIWLCKHIEWVS
jgi:hypothetical protein